jgi:hypothetical protein
VASEFPGMDFPSTLFRPLSSGNKTKSFLKPVGLFGSSPVAVAARAVMTMKRRIGRRSMRSSITGRDRFRPGLTTRRIV